MPVIWKRWPSSRKAVLAVDDDRGIGQVAHGYSWWLLAGHGGLDEGGTDLAEVEAGGLDRERHGRGLGEAGRHVDLEEPYPAPVVDDQVGAREVAQPEHLVGGQRDPGDLRGQLASSSGAGVTNSVEPAV